MAYRRILVSMKTYLGDAVMAEPLLRRLRANIDEVVCLTSPYAAEMLGIDKQPSQYTPFQEGRRLSAIIRHGRQLRERDFEAVILLNHSYRSALIAKFAKIPRRIGHAREYRGWLLTDPLPYDADGFEAFVMSDLAKSVGVEAPSEPPHLDVTQEEREQGLMLLQGATVGFQPGARYAEKTLPIGKSIDIAHQLQSRGIRLAMFGGPEEKKFGDEVNAALDGSVVDLIGKTTIRQTMGCLAGLKAMFGNDTGVMHMSVAVGCPSVQIFGTPKADKWGHFYPPNRVLRAPSDDLTRMPEDEVVCAVLELLER